MRLSMASVVFAAALAAVVAVTVLVNGVVSGATSDTEGMYKIGIVDLQFVVDSYEKRKDEVTKLEAEVETQNNELKTLQDTFQKKLEDYRTQKATLGESERAEHEADLDREALALESKVRQAETSLERKKRQLKQSIITDITAAVDKIGASENYHLIIEADPETRTGVLYYTKTIDISTKVIAELNK